MGRITEEQVKEKKQFVHILLLISAIISALKIPDNMVWTFLLFIMFLLVYYVGLSREIIKNNPKILNITIGFVSAFFSINFAFIFTNSFSLFYTIDSISWIAVFFTYYFGFVYILIKILSFEVEGEDNINKKIFEFIRTHWIEIIGAVILLIGIILFFIFCETDWCEIGKILIPTGIAIIATGISISSDKKLKESQYIEFRRLRGQFEDIRLTIRERRFLLQRFIKEKEKPNLRESTILLDEIKAKEIKEYEIRYSFGIWKCKTYIDEINTIKKRLTDKDQKSIIRLLALYYAELLAGRAMLSTGEIRAKPL